MKIINFSENIILNEIPTNENINIIYQFFIHKNNDRDNEIKKCLKYNVNNKYITKIYLLNEKIYTNSELGIKSNKIHQYDIKNRLKYKDIFEFINNYNINGYNIFLNADIFLDETINNLNYTDLYKNKIMLALLRYEYNELKNKKTISLESRFDSQDTWIIHSNFKIKKNEEKIFNFEFGKPGCDNKIIYLMNILGYKILNDPYLIKTYHYHKTEIRDYSPKDVINKPWGVIVPNKTDINKIKPSLGIDLNYISNKTNNFKDYNFNDNDKLYNYIENKIKENKNFIIPRIAGIENNYALQGIILYNNNNDNNNDHINEYINKTIHIMKNNAGIKLIDNNSIIKYSLLYLDSFQNCDLYAGWEPFGDVYKYISQSHDFITDTFKKEILWAFVFDIFHYIHSRPWTLSLRGKRILIISAFETSIKDKIENREKIYGIDLFPECTIITIKPPQTQGNEDSQEFDIELKNFTDKLDLIKNDFDIALVSCGGYGNLVCNYIYKILNKSAIYVGGVLQMYFGILGQRWLRERPDIIRLYLNEYWTKPQENEKPKGYNLVEKSCYW
jgi:hypothetical protein